eukprot:1739455-Lingulodinium_polyedra.AAC.1
MGGPRVARCAVGVGRLAAKWADAVRQHMPELHRLVDDFQVGLAFMRETAPGLSLWEAREWLVRPLQEFFVASKKVVARACKEDRAAFVERVADEATRAGAVEGPKLVWTAVKQLRA